MKRFVWQWLVISSVLAAALMAETRPQYGGTLHVSMHEALKSVDPADSSADSLARRSVILLVSDTMIALDQNGRPQPALATSWQTGSGNQHWRFQIRRNVKFHDGTTLTAEVAASSLRAANPSWNISVDGEALVIERAETDTPLLAELARARNAIAKDDSAGKLVGTGPFRVEEWQSQRRLMLAANEECWRGRPYLDSIEIELGRSYRDQMTELELGKADVVEIPPEQTHRASLEGRQVQSSEPVELVAIAFRQDANSDAEKLLRQALALSVERGSMRNVLLQGAGQPAGGLLPTWMSGYGFVFPVDADPAQARHEREQVKSVPTWSLGYDGSDTLARLLAERVALNAKDVGLLVQTTSAEKSDMRLVRIALSSENPWVSLTELAGISAGAGNTKKQGSVEDLYAAEQSVLAARRIIPMFHLPVSYAAGTMVKGWSVGTDGILHLADAWLGPRQP